MNVRLDYLRILEIFLNYNRIDGKHLIPLSDFIQEVDVIFIANPSINSDEVLDEMYSLELISQGNYDHLFGDDGVLLLEKGWKLLEQYRNMELPKAGNAELEVIIKTISQKPDKGQKDSYLITLHEISKSYSSECYTACIALCGKTLEILFYELLNNSLLNDDLYRIDEKTQKKYPRNDLSLWKLRSMAARLPGIKPYLLPQNEVISTINAYRNASVHFAMVNYNPSKRIVDGVIHFLVDTLEKYFSE